MHVPCISTPSQFICVTQLSKITTYLRVFVPLLKEKYYSVCKECPTGMIHCCGCFKDKNTVGQVYTGQLDTSMRVAGRILLGEDYIMRSVFEQAPITFMHAGVCTRECYTYFE